MSLNYRSCRLLMHRVEKYRPVTLDDVVSHQDITATSELYRGLGHQTADEQSRSSLMLAVFRTCSCMGHQVRLSSKVGSEFLTSRNGQDLDRPRPRSTVIRPALPQTHPRIERFRRPRYRCRPGPNQKLCHDQGLILVSLLPPAAVPC